MSKVLAFAIQKGGVGKTTTVLTVGKELGKMGYKILMIDLDAQGTLSQIMGVKPYKDQKTVQHFLGIGTEAVDFEEVKVNIEKNIDLLPSNIAMTYAEEVLTTMDNSAMLLSKKLNKIKNIYDYILIDCPPSLHAFMKNGIMASDYIVIPVKPDVASVLGIELFIDTLYRLSSSYDKEFDIAGILFTMVNERTVAYQEVKKFMEENVKNYNTKLFNSSIRQSVNCSNAVGSGENIIESDKNSNVAKDYKNFIDELLETINEVE